MKQKTPKADFEILQDKNRIVYDHDQLVWHWKQENRPVRCAVDLTIYRNETNTGITVTDNGLEDASSSYKDTFGVHPSRGDVRYVLGHTTPGRLVFEPSSCGDFGRHGICPDADRNNLTAEFDPDVTYRGTVLAHLNESKFVSGCCITFLPEETRLASSGRHTACYVRTSPKTIQIMHTIRPDQVI
jgi:hypothetical protein